MIQPTTALATILATMRHALLAQDCVLCAAPSGDDALCHACAAELPALGPHCPQCANAVTEGRRCGACLVAPPAFDATLAVWRYTYPLDRLVQALKYGGRLALADGFGRALAAHAEAHATAIDLIVPMPLHEKRLRARGFNQAVEIARALARCSGKTAIDTRALVRWRDTPAQAGLPHDARAGNVRDAFACTASLDGLRIALIDDVMTTGATADAAARALKRAGAAHVESWVVARAMTSL